MLDAIERSSLSLTGTGDGLVFTTYEALEDYLEKAYPQDNPELYHSDVAIFLHDTYQEINNKKDPAESIGEIIFSK